MKDTHLFRQEAIKFLATGQYIEAPPGTQEYMEYWTEQLHRCRYGYEVNGQRVTGDHYGYMNFAQIRLTEDPNQLKEKVASKKTRSAKKKISFPDFWDGDYEFFWAVEIARNGISEEDYKKLGLRINIKQLDGGHHLCVAKSRRKGFSYKIGWIAANRYNCTNDYTTILGAFEKKYLYPEGTMTMATNYLNFINEHTAWRKKRQKANKVDHVRASFYEELNGVMVEKGYKSQIIAVTFKNNPDAARGKDGDLIIFEEAGAFDNLKNSYMATRPAVEDGIITTGQIIVFGTGGDMEGGTIDFESMFYDPEPYNMIAIENIWDEGAEGTDSGLFFPVYQNLVGFMDKDGNSLIEEAQANELTIRDRIKTKSNDPRVIAKYSTEYPFTPREAFFQTTLNIFPIAELSKHRNNLMIHNTFKHMATHGKLTRTNKGLKFFPDPDARPVVKFPTSPGDDIAGCVSMYQAPYRDENGNIPVNLYVLVHDPYGTDSEGGESLGSAYVIKRTNIYSQPDDMIVASYVGRPASQDEYNEGLFKLAEYYNAKIGFENDRGEVVPYAKRHKLLHWLMHEVEIVDKTANINIRKLGRKYGTSMGSKQRKSQAQIYLRDWLMTTNGMNEDGEFVYNFQKIYDLALLDELIRFNPKKGNFDRVSAMLIGQFYIIDMYNKVVRREDEEEAGGEDGTFFSRTCFN